MVLTAIRTTAEQNQTEPNTWQRERETNEKIKSINQKAINNNNTHHLYQFISIESETDIIIIFIIR